MIKNFLLKKLSETEDRLDPPFFILKDNAGEMIDWFSPLLGSIKKSGPRFKPETDDQKDSEYPILSVTNDGKISLNELIKWEDFTQSYKKVSTGDIVYNPYRVNIGSIGVVPKELDGWYVSPAYVVFTSTHLDAQFLVNLMRSPFYKLYIDVVSTGSIRDSLSYDLLETIRIPTIGIEEQKKINKDLVETGKKLGDLIEEIDINKEAIIEKMHNLLV